MMIKEDFIKRITSGQPTKYDKEKHIGLLFDIFNKGEGVMAFCADAMISQTTFFSWLKKHREFSEAYKVIINQAGRKWESYPINPKVNMEFSYWSIIMRNRFGYGKSRFKIADNKNAKEMMQTAKEHLDEDMITVNDYTAIVNSAKMQAIIDGECNDTEVYRPSSREELLEKKALLENIVETQAKITQMQRTNENPKISKGKIIS
jgi:hypothetical protein